MKIDTEKWMKAIAQLVACIAVAVAIFVAGAEYGRDHQAKATTDEARFEYQLVYGWPAKIDKQNGTVELLRSAAPIGSDFTANR